MDIGERYTAAHQPTPEGVAAPGEKLDAADDYVCPCGKPQAEHCGSCYHCPGTHDECCGW